MMKVEQIKKGVRINLKNEVFTVEMFSKRKETVWFTHDEQQGYEVDDTGFVAFPIDYVLSVGEIVGVEQVIPPTTQKLSTLLKQERKALGISRRILAEKAGVSEGIIKLIEHGRESASILIVRKIFNVFGKPIKIGDSEIIE